MNSWQQPVSGEPSLGTPHPSPLDGSNLRQIYSGTPATTPSTTEVDVSSYVPMGTKAIYIEGVLRVGSNTQTSLRASKTISGNFDNGIWTCQGYGATAFQDFPFSGIVQLDSSRKFWIYRSNTSLVSCQLFLVLYYI